MKLVETSRNWQVQSLGRDDVNAPLRVANAEAQAARAWSNVFESGSKLISDVAMDIYKVSNEQEEAELYNQALNEINGLENQVLTQPTFQLDSDFMEGIDYDDEKYVPGENGAMGETINTGSAPVHEVGAQIWSNESTRILNNTVARGSNPVVKKAVAAKIASTLTNKSQNVGRHIITSAQADRKAGVTMSIDISRREGNTPDALRIANNAHDLGILSRKELNDYNKETMQQRDQMVFAQLVDNTSSQEELSQLSDDVLVQNSYMTTSQKIAASGKALAKIKFLRAEQEKELGLRQDGAEVQTIIDLNEGTTNTQDILDHPEKYNRAGFARMVKMSTTTVPQVSNGMVIGDYQKRIVGIQFEAGPENTVTDLEQEIKREMASSLKKGTLTYDDYNKLTADLDLQREQPFKSQQYQQAKKVLFVDILGNLDPMDMQQIQAAGVNIDAIILQKLGQKPNISILAINAYQDLNAYMNTFGFAADPVEWWDKNKNNYKADGLEERNAGAFGDAYPDDAVRLGGGKVDIKATEDNLVRKFRNGDYGDPNKAPALLELDKRMGKMKGMDMGAYN